MNHAPNIQDVRVVRNASQVAYDRIEFTAIDPDTNQTLTAAQLALIQFEYRIQLWRRPRINDDDRPVFNKTFVLRDNEALVDIRCDPNHRIKIEVTPQLRSAAVPWAVAAQPTQLINQFSRTSPMRLVVDPSDLSTIIANLRSYTPEFGDELGVRKARILLAHQRSGGKSSFICSVVSLVDGTRYVQATIARPAQGGGVTYEFKVHSDKNAPNFELIDSPGTTFDMLDIETMCLMFKYIVLGRIKLPFKFAERDRPPTAEWLREQYFNVPDAPIDKRVHVVALVFDAETFDKDTDMKKLQKLLETVGDYCKIVGIVTGADRLRRAPLVGNVVSTARDEFEIELNLERLPEFAEAVTHIQNMASNAKLDVNDVVVTSNLLGRSPTDPEMLGRCILTGNAMQVLLNRADDLFRGEHARLVESQEQEIANQQQEEDLLYESQPQKPQQQHQQPVRPNPNPGRLRPHQARQ